MRRCCVRYLDTNYKRYLSNVVNRPSAESQRRLSWRAPPSDRCKNMMFVIPQCNSTTVPIAHEYLDRAPESVLAIAAQRAPPNSNVSLKDWPDANVAVLQVGVMTQCHAMPGSPQVADKQLLLSNGASCTQGLTYTCTQVVIGCLSGHNVRESMAGIQENQLLQALEYFNLPESMWPLGLHLRHSHCLKCDKVAKQLMTTIKTDFSKMVEQDTKYAAAFTKRYGVYDDEQGLHLEAINARKRGLSSYCSTSEPLQWRLRDLAAAECLAIEFESCLDFNRQVYARIAVSLSCFPEKNRKVCAFQ